MKHSNVYLKMSTLGKIVIALFFLSLPLSQSYAKAGCCARHGGVTGCNAASGHLQCKDGTDSASCPCDGSSAPTTKSTKVKPSTNTNNTSTTSPVVTPSKSVKTTGCCRGHGGVAGCNTATGYQKCKDGSSSPSCVCEKSNKSTTKTLTTPVKPAKTAGCCRGHGGVAQCNKATGYQKCKDGTMSPSCKCS